MRPSDESSLHTPPYGSIRQHTSAYVNIRQHTAAYAHDAGELAKLGECKRLEQPLLQQPLLLVPSERHVAYT